MSKKETNKKEQVKEETGTDIAKIPTPEEAGLSLTPAGAIAPFDPIVHLPALEKLADIFLASGLLPSGVDSKAKAVTIMIKSHELGIPYMTGLSHLHVVKGKPSMSSELMRSLIFERCPGAIIDIKEMSAAKCIIITRRPGQKQKQFSFTYEEAKLIVDSKTGKRLVDKDNWKNYRPDLLLARCTSRMGRAYYPDIIRGVSYTPEELGAVMNEAGEFISTAEEIPEDPPAATIEKVEKKLTKRAAYLLEEMGKHYDGPKSDDEMLSVLRTVTRTPDSPEDDGVESFFDLDERRADSAFFRWKALLLSEQITEATGSRKAALQYLTEATTNPKKEFAGVETFAQVNNQALYGILKTRFFADKKDGLFKDVEDDKK